MDLVYEGTVRGQKKKRSVPQKINAEVGVGTRPRRESLQLCECSEGLPCLLLICSEPNSVKVTRLLSTVQRCQGSLLARADME